MSQLRLRTEPPGGRHRAYQYVRSLRMEQGGAGHWAEGSRRVRKAGAFDECGAGESVVVQPDSAEVGRDGFTWRQRAYFDPPATRAGSPGSRWWRSGSFRGGFVWEQGRRWLAKASKVVCRWGTAARRALAWRAALQSERAGGVEGAPTILWPDAKRRRLVQGDLGRFICIGARTWRSRPRTDVIARRAE
jgi:hypothetical protein